MAVIANKDDDLKYKRQQIELFFSVHTDQRERADYLKSAYQDRYTEIIADGQRLGYKPQEDGLLMWAGSYLSRTKESVFSWDLVAGWTAQLIDKKEYFIQTDIRQLPTQESQQMSLFDFPSFGSSTPSEGEPQRSLFSRPALSQQVIDEALCIGANDQNSRLIICAYFKKDKPLEDNARFLMEHYGENGAGFYLDSRKYQVIYLPMLLLMFVPTSVPVGQRLNLFLSQAVAVWRPASFCRQMLFPRAKSALVAGWNPP